VRSLLAPPDEVLAGVPQSTLTQHAQRGVGAQLLHLASLYRNPRPVWGSGLGV